MRFRDNVGKMAASTKKQRTEEPSVETLERELRQVLARHHAARRDGVVVPSRLVIDELADRAGRLTRVTLSLSDRPARHSELTERQLEILALIVAGMPSRDIARRLGRSMKTIEAHRSHIMRRLGVKNLASLMRVALARDLTRTGTDVD